MSGYMKASLWETSLMIHFQNSPPSMGFPIRKPPIRSSRSFNGSRRPPTVVATLIGISGNLFLVTNDFLHLGCTKIFLGYTGLSQARKYRLTDSFRIQNPRMWTGRRLTDRNLIKYSRNAVPNFNASIHFIQNALGQQRRTPCYLQNNFCPYGSCLLP